MTILLRALAVDIETCDERNRPSAGAHVIVLALRCFAPGNRFRVLCPLSPTDASKDMEMPSTLNRAVIWEG